jgi:hypothetical protein
MEQNFVVLDPDDRACGTLRMSICSAYPELDDVLPFSRLVGDARYHRLADPLSLGFTYFEKQLPSFHIYPVAVLLDLEIRHEKRRRGYGTMALAAFAAVAVYQGARLAMLRIGTTGTDDDNYKDALLWRKDFYSKSGWVAFDSPPLPGLVLVWMYRLLPALPARELALRDRLVKAKPENDGSGPVE